MANGMNNSFGLTLFGKMEDLLATNGIFQEDRASRANFQRDGCVDRHAKFSRFRLAHCITSEAGQLILLYIQLVLIEKI
jgi:hypothetical protein